MLVLRSSGASPFVRKVRIAADIVGLADRIEIVDAETLTPAPDLLEQNPLGKIPTLVLENGDTLYDSRVILEYLDLLGAGRLIPQGSRRFAALRLQALADGLMDAAVLQMYEIRWRPEEHRVEKWVAHQKGKVARALDEAEGSLDAPGRRSTSAISRSPARSAISTCASRASGATTTRSSSPGSTISQDACRRSRRRG